MGLRIMTVKGKLAMLILMGCLSLVIVGAVSIGGISRLNEALGRSNQELNETSRYNDLEKGFLNVRLCVAYILFLTDADKMKAKSDEMERHLAAIKEVVAALDKGAKPRERELLASFQEGVHAYVQEAVKLGEMARGAAFSGNHDDRVAMITYATSRVAPLARKPTESLAQLVKNKLEGVNRLCAVNATAAGRVRTAILGVIIVTIAVSGVAGLLVVRSLVRPIFATISRLRDIAEGEGDLTKRLDVDCNDELGELGTYFNRFMDKLRAIIADVAVTAERVAAISAKLRSTSELIATGTERMVAQSQAVATAGEEMAATANDIAANCQNAAVGAKDAADSATGGTLVVENTIQVMARIAERVKDSAATVSTLGKRSDQIGTIVGTIEDIADQTNLLALNAAIEAARAGDQGRGFAVVADEVRALAERTTNATREIGAMIKAIQGETRAAVGAMEEGVAEVENGTAEAARSGGALRNILEQANAVTMQISQVATAAEEQTATTHEISSNIQQITEVVEQTARGAEETASAAAQLAGQAGELQSLVGRFRLG